MHNVILFDGSSWATLRPLTLTRPTAECMVGIFTIRQKWEAEIKGTYSHLTQPYLKLLYPSSWTHSNLLLNGSVLPTDKLLSAINSLKPDEVLVDGEEVIAFVTAEQKFELESIPSIIQGRKKISVESSRLTYPEDILNFCDIEYRKDYKTITKERSTAPVDKSVKVRGAEIFIEPSAKVYDCILNATDGPIYIGKNAEIMENAVIKGPVCIGDNSTVHVGTKVYAHTMLGPWSKIGGEIKRSTIMGYSNKAHDGYLGDSVIGRWCNMGADTNNSNMKNTYGLVSLWDISQDTYRTTDRQFLGLIMGDHTMCAINTAFMTGSVTGVFANVFGESPKRWTPSFSWGNANVAYDVNRAIQVAERAQSRRNIKPDENYKEMLRYIASQS